MKQPALFNVPKDAPSHKERLDAFKVKIGIWTHNLEDDHSDSKWMAMLLPKSGNGAENYSDHRCYCDGSDDPFEIIAGYCRIMDETGRTANGETEREAVERLCDGLKIPFDLSPIKLSEANE